MSGQQKRAVRDIIAALAERFPACFSLDRYRKPLKVGIHDEVLAALPDVPAKQVGLALMVYTSSSRYLLACTKEGRPRVGLTGEEVGHVTADEAENARQRLEQVTAAEAEKRLTKSERVPLRARRAKPAKQPIKAKPARSPIRPVAPRLGLSDLRAAARARRDAIARAD